MRAAALDASDPLRRFRDAFALPDGIVYLDGNSLGALPKATAARVAEVVATEWGVDLITSWNKHGWIALPSRVGDKIGRLVGAAAGQVVASDSTSVNLFKLLAAALALRPGRRVLLSDRANFPTDLYIAQGLAALLDRGIALRLVETDDVAGAIDGDVAVVMLTEVDYRTGRLQDMAAITRRAHAAGALALWDLAHSAGALPVDLDGCRVDLAVGCGYKYLNGGPGAPAFLYVAERHQAAVRQPLSGWLGHAAPFDFDADYRPAEGIRRTLCGTPGILGLAALEVGVDLLLQADMVAVRAKSLALGDRLIAAVEQACPGALGLATPTEAARRGSQVCFTHPEGYAIMQALIARGVVGDFRTPDILRFGLAPLYTRYADIDRAAATIAEVIAARAWDRPAYRQRAVVT